MSKKLLVVDDFNTMRRMVIKMLKELGFEDIVEAPDGAVAFDLLKENEIDLIISDWNMPNMTGIELLEKVRATDGYQDTPFIMVTAEGQKEQVIEAVKKGVTGYIIKPFTADVLKEKIADIFPDG